MLKYELKKIWRNKFFLVFLFLFICMDMILIYQNNLTQINTINSEIYIRGRKLYQEIKGPITFEKINKLKTKAENKKYYGLMAEMMYFDMKNVYEYQKRSEEAAKLAKSNIEFYTLHGEERLAQYNYYVIELFEKRNIDEYYIYEGIDAYFKHGYSVIIVIIMLFSGCASLFYRDRKDGMYLIIYTSKYGKNSLWKWKVNALLVSAVILVTGFRFVEYMVYFYLYRFDGLHMPLYCVWEYAASFYGGSILSVLFIDLLFKLLGIVFAGFILSILSWFLKRQWLSCIMFGFIIYLLPFFNELFQPYKILKECQLVYIGNWYLNKLWFIAGVIGFLCILFYIGSELISWRRTV